MSCITHVNLCPSSGDTENVLLQKILQSLNEGGGGSGGGAGVSSLAVNGGPAETGAVSLNVVTGLSVDGGPFQTGDVSIVSGSSLLNFTDETADADAVVWGNAGTTELIRAVGATSDVQIGPSAMLTLRGSDGRLSLAGRASFNTISTVGHLLNFTDASNSTSQAALTLLHTLSAGVGAAGIGVRLDFNLDSDTTPNTLAARWDTTWSVATHATRNSLSTFSNFVNGGETPQMILGNNQIAGNPGTAPIPAFTNRNDVDTGMWFPFANRLGLAVGGEDAFQLTSSTGRYMFASATASSTFNLRIERSRGTTNSPTVITAGDFLGKLSFSGYDGSGQREAGIIRVDNVGTVAANRVAGVMRFFTNTDAAPSVSTQRLVLDQQGFVGLGPSTTPSGNLDVNNSSTTTVSYFYATTDGNASPTNYARLALLPGNAADTAVIRTEAGGTGLTVGLPRILKVGTGPSTGTDIAGNSVIWHSGQGTGSGTGGSHLFQVSAPGATASTVRALATRLTLNTTDLTMATAVRLAVASGANQRAGETTLVAGSSTVANTSVTAGTIVMLTRKTSGGTVGFNITYTVTAATSFTITSDSVLDTSTFSYFLIEVP